MSQLNVPWSGASAQTSAVHFLHAPHAQVHPIPIQTIPAGSPDPEASIATGPSPVIPIRTIQSSHASHAIPAPPPVPVLIALPQARPAWAESAWAGFGPVLPPKSLALSYFLAVCFGLMGAHRFYLGKYGTGLLWFFTGGLCGIGWIADLCLLAPMVADINARRAVGVH